MNRGAGGGLRLPVLVVVGTRPEAIKAGAIILALRDSASFAPVVIGTGQHLWPVLVRSILRQLTERRGWAKTDREPIADTPAARPAGPS
jgi:UDP-N-acetylglucosamine 2-epimerase